MPESKLIPLKLQSGVVKTRSGEGAKGRWYDAQNVRFMDGNPEKRAGFVQYATALFQGRARGMRAWNTVKGKPLYGLGTHLKIYGSTDGIEPIDITPLRFPVTVKDAFTVALNAATLTYKEANTKAGTLTNPFTTTNGSTTVTVAHTAHGLTTGNFIGFANATAVGGITINGGYTVTVVNANSYTIVAASAATSAATGGGTVDYRLAKYSVGSKVRFYGNSWQGGTQVGGITLSREYEVISVDTVDTYKILPNDKKATLTGPFTTQSGQTLVTVQDPAHGQDTGAIAYFSGASAVGGVTPAGEYKITKVDADKYTITVASAASSGATGGGTVTRYFAKAATAAATNTGTVGVVNYLSNPFVTTSGQTAVTVNMTAHGAKYNDALTIFGATTFNGVTLSGEYRIVSVTNENSFVINAATAANAAGSGGGTAVYIEFQIPPGPADRILEKRGFGKGSFGFGAFGSTTLALDPIYYDPRSVAIDNVGEDAIFCPLGDNLYYWDSSAGGRAEIIPNAPTQLRYAFMTEERHLHVLGANGDPLVIAWASQDAINDWTPTDTNTANSSRRVRDGSALVAGTSVSNGINLIWTDTAVYTHQYTGSQFIYDTRRAAANAGLIGPRAFCNTPIGPVWMSQNKFYYWNGAATEVPNSPEMADWIFDQIDKTQWSKCWLMYDAINDSVYVYYVPRNSGEPSQYVIINLVDFSWVNGTETRTTGAVFDAGDKKPLMTGTNGKIYLHEQGLDADGEPMEAYIEYAPLDLGNGAVWHEALGLDPNFKRQVGNVEFSISTYDRNNLSEVDSDTVTLEEGTEIADLRVSGRRHSGRFSQSVLGGDFSIDTPLLEVKPMGARR